MNPILTSKSCPYYTLSLPPNHPNLWSMKPNVLNHLSGMNNTIVGLWTIDPTRVGGLFGNSIFLNTTRKLVIQFQLRVSSTILVLPYSGDSSSNNQQQFQNFNTPTMGTNTSVSTMSMMP